MIKNEKDTAAMGLNPIEKKDGQCNVVKVERDIKDSQRAKELKIAESDMVRELKAQLK